MKVRLSDKLSSSKEDRKNRTLKILEIVDFEFLLNFNNFFINDRSSLTVMKPLNICSNELCVEGLCF